MFATILIVLVLLLHLAIAVLLVRQYIRTRDVGFVWLGAAVVIWPLISRLLDASERVLVARILNNQWVGVYPFTLIKSGQMRISSLITSLSLLQQLIGVCLLLIAIFYLSKTKSNSVHAAA
jgi:hypothetical protein